HRRPAHNRRREARGERGGPGARGGGAHPGAGRDAAGVRRRRRAEARARGGARRGAPEARRQTGRCGAGRAPAAPAPRRGSVQDGEMRALACIVLLALAGPARADQPQLAEALFDDAMRLMEQRRYADARDKLLESLRYLDGLGTRGKLAECYEKLGATATAWAEWREVEARARNNGEAAPERVAPALVEALAAGPTSLRIVPPRPGIAGISVVLDDVALGAAALAAPFPVDPGPHRLRADAPGRVPWSTTVTLVDGASETIAVPR